MRPDDCYTAPMEEKACSYPPTFSDWWQTYADTAAAMAAFQSDPDSRNAERRLRIIMDRLYGFACTIRETT
jgi:hypothetical protein